MRTAIAAAISALAIGIPGLSMKEGDGRDDGGRSCDRGGYRVLRLFHRVGDGGDAERYVAGPPWTEAAVCEGDSVDRLYCCVGNCQAPGGLQCLLRIERVSEKASPNCGKANGPIRLAYSEWYHSS